MTKKEKTIKLLDSAIEHGTELTRTKTKKGVFRSFWHDGTIHGFELVNGEITKHESGNRIRVEDKSIEELFNSKENQFIKRTVKNRIQRKAMKLWS